MIKNLCSIIIKKTHNLLIFNMIQYPPIMLGRGILRRLKFRRKSTTTFSNIQVFACFFVSIVFFDKLILQSK